MQNQAMIWCRCFVLVRKRKNTEVQILPPSLSLRSTLLLRWSYPFQWSKVLLHVSKCSRTRHLMSFMYWTRFDCLQQWGHSQHSSSMRQELCFTITWKKVQVSKKATGDSGNLLLQSRQTGWHPKSSFFIPKTAAVCAWRHTLPVRSELDEICQSTPREVKCQIQGASCLMTVNTIPGAVGLGEGNTLSKFK